jgi:hypothetical protein
MSAEILVGVVATLACVGLLVVAWWIGRRERTTFTGIGHGFGQDDEGKPVVVEGHPARIESVTSPTSVEISWRRGRRR